MLEVLGRSIVTGAAAGVVAGLLTLPAVSTYELLAGNPAAPVSQPGGLAGGLVVLALYALVVGGAAGAVFGVPAGLLLGALRPRLTRRPARCRVAGLAVCGGLVGSYALVLALLGTSPVWWVLLCASELVVAIVVGWWRGPALVDGAAARQS